MGPLEFIGAIRGSSLLVTDSFHATVFASLFHRPFALVPRGRMNSRFETLLRHVGLTDRMLTQISDVPTLVDIDWSAVDSRLQAERAKSRGYLAKALGLNPE